ncbi:indolepyruvate oxidoreductase [Gordonibacter sp. 28C]|uniref:thiamine pyrophosphate-dependent enzyme n=1 Tax=Gordonibacter sp. 28C TaxID=2078569 RepID=UPI000DF7E653|nr:thiamine pyrophosphate-dependent enzyme [Gordonibacter sp. 28C]RDB59695.1 indolepyruvate oxidoreductase [Gordonibacter sp. 28C]
MTKKLLMGNEAFAHAALEAGVRVVAGYPGTPSSELIETVAKLHASGAARGVHVEWSTNEKSALELLAGASYTGARCLFTCKQVGLNVASDPLMSLNYVGVKGGTVLFVADDPGPISSQTEQDTRRFAAFAKMPVLDPSTPDEGFAMMRAAFDLSERYHTPVIVRPTTRINHASTFFEVADATDARPVPDEGFERDPKWIIFPRRAYQAHGEINERLAQIARDFAHEPALAAFNPMVEGGATSEGTPRLGIVAGGVSAAYAREALRMVETRAAEHGIEVPAYRFWQVGTPFPFPEDAAARFAEGLEQVLVLEELDHVLEDELLKHAGRAHAPYQVKGKLTGDARDRGENDVDDVAARLARFLGVAEAAAAGEPLAYDTADDPLPVRPPVLCAGCPHRGSFYAVKRALGKAPAVLCGDIGCYTLGNAMPLDAVDTCLCMGAGITMAQGFAVAEPHKKHVSFVGDSTFFASGLPGIVNAVYNGHDITVCVLDNATTAMTGSQPHPGTGVTLMGPKREPVSIERVLEAVGFGCIVHADPLDLEGSVAAAKEALDYEGPSAVLFESPCVQLVKPGAPATVDADACTGCKKCITEIGCPGIGFDADARGPKSRERGQAFVDASLCNGCGLCTQVCPFDALCHPERSAQRGVEGSRPGSFDSGGNAASAQDDKLERGSHA